MTEESPCERRRTAVLTARILAIAGEPISAIMTAAGMDHPSACRVVDGWSFADGPWPGGMTRRGYLLVVRRKPAGIEAAKTMRTLRW